MICFQVFGNDLAIASAVTAGQLELNVMMPLIAHNLCQSIEILSNGTRAFARKGVDGLTIDEPMIRYWLERNTMLATALAPTIGYAAAAEIAKEAVATGETIPVVARRLTELSETELVEALDPAPMTEPGVRTGGGGGG